MGIVSGLNEQKGIQYFDTQIAPGIKVPGHGALVRYGNTLYLVYAMHNASSTEKNLLFSRSDNGADTWSPPVILTTGNFDDEPASLVLDPTDPASDIGIVFVREDLGQANNQDARTMFRFTVDQSGNRTSPIDAVNNVPLNAFSISLVHLGPGYGLVFLYDSGAQGGTGSRINIQNNLTDFTTNNWQTYENPYGAYLGTTGSFPFPPLDSAGQLARMKIKQLVNGDYALLCVYETATNGQLYFGTGERTSRFDVCCSFSQDNMQSWSPLQNLTNYSWTPQWDMLPHPGAANMDFAQLSDTSIQVIYTEVSGQRETITQPTTNYHTVPGDENTSITAAAVGSVIESAYHPQHNLLIQATGGRGFEQFPNGFYVTDLTSGVTRRFYTASRADLAIWDNDCRTIAISPTGQYIAVASFTALEIYDCTDREPNNWLHLASLRMTSDTPLHSQVSTVRFLDDTTLLCGWANSGIGRCCFSLLNVSRLEDGFEDIFLPPGDGRQVMDAATTVFYSTKTVGGLIQRVVVFAAQAGPGSPGFYYINLDNPKDCYSGNVTNQADSITYGNTYTQQNDLVFYDDLNKQYLYLNQNRQLGGFTVNPNASGQGGTITVSGPVPNMGNVSTVQSFMFLVPGQGFVFYASTNTSASEHGAGLNYYSFKHRQNMGLVNIPGNEDLSADFPGNLYTGAFGLEVYPIIPYGKGVTVGGQYTNFILDGNTLLGVHIANTFYLWNINHRGRLLGGVFPYDSVNQKLTADGVNFYDLVSQAKIGPGYDCVDMPAVEVLSDDTAVVYGKVLNLYNGDFPLGAFTGIVGPNALKINARARIIGKSKPSFTTKSHIAGIGSRSANVKASIVSAQCLKVQAHVVPRPNESLIVQANISNTKRNFWPITFAVDAGTNRTGLTLQFWADTGYTGLGTAQLGARIIRKQQKRFTGHFLVTKAAPGSAVPLSFSASSTANQFLGAKAKIS